jgi:hypothetical protein
MFGGSLHDMASKSHQEPVPIDDTIKLSEQELEDRSSKNVERWISLHIIPVRKLLLFIHHCSTYAARALGISYLAFIADVSDSGRRKDRHI